MGSDEDDFPPWPPERWPTDEEWVDWFLSLPRKGQLARARRLIENAQLLEQRGHST